MQLRFAMLCAVLALTSVGTVAAQATGTPTFNAPYRAFKRSEIGVVLSFPEGGGTALEGMYRIASGKVDFGFKAGFIDVDGGDAVVLAGVEARHRVLTHTEDFPLDGAVVIGVGGWFQSDSYFLLPIGLSLGRRLDLQESQLSIVPYVQPTLTLVGGDSAGDDVRFTLGLGADFRFTPRFDGRVSVGLGDAEGVSLAFVWVH